MKNRVLALLLTTIIALPELLMADIKKVTIEWMTPSTSTINIVDYNMYYSYGTNPPNIQNFVSNCNRWEETTPNNFTMVCPEVDIQQYPVYFFIGAVKQDGKVIISPYDKIAKDKFVISPPRDLKIIN